MVTESMNPYPLRVVCGLLFFQGRLLVTRRDPRRSFPLLWEFPGGKVEPEEEPMAALHRELEEELALRVDGLRALDPVRYRAPGHAIDLLPFVGRPAQAHGPVPLDHVEIRWIRPEEAGSLEWAPADRPLLPLLASLAMEYR